MDPLAAFKLTDRTAVVTGGGSGIGRATAETLAAAGARVVVADVSTDGIAQTVAAITEAGGTAVGQPTDVTSKEQVDALVARAVDEFGGLDIMCNVAGIPADGFLSDVTEDEFDTVFAVNVKGVLFGCQAAVDAMRAAGTKGSIINVGSTGVDAPAKRYGLYAMSKASVAMLTQTLAIEAGKFGIRVNTIHPGTTVTAFTMRHVYDEDGNVVQERYDMFLDAMRKVSVIGEIGEAQDQANLILYLASDAAKFATGQIWRVNGGQAIVW